MKKIIIGLSNDFLKSAYVELFKEEEFNIFETNNGKELLSLIKKEMPDIVIADIGLSEMGALEILEEVKKDISIANIPFFVFSSFERKENKDRAIELEATDFITADSVTPREVVLKVKISLGEQRSFRISIDKDSYDAEELIKDMAPKEDIICRRCRKQLILYLIKDLSKGPNYFKLSFICPECNTNNNEK